MIIERIVIYPNQDNKIILEVGDRVEENVYITKLEVIRAVGNDYIQVFHDGNEKTSVIYAGVPYAVFYDLEEK